MILAFRLPLTYPESGINRKQLSRDVDIQGC
jgi:hypothetical protein